MGGDGGGSPSSHSASTLSFHSYLFWGFDITGTEKPFNKEAGPGSIMYYHKLALQETNPYDTAVTNVVDPEVDGGLNDAETELDALDALIDELDPTTGTDIDAMVNSFEQAQEPQFMRSINRVTGPLADINAAEGFAFVMALTLLESEFTRTVAAFRASLSREFRFEQTKQKHAAVALRLEFVKMKTVALVDKVEQEADYSMRAITFEMDLFEKPGNLLANLNGAHNNGQPIRNRAASALSGAFSGASIGASVGGAPGAGIGAVLGGTAGLLF